MDMERRPVPKHVLERLQEMGTALGAEIIRPSDVDNEFDADFGRGKIKEKYKERYIAYRKLLANGEHGDSESLEKLKVWIRALNNLDDYITTHKNEGGILREKQATVFEDIRDSFEEGNTAGYVKLPTGVGKTILFSQIIESMKMRTLILVPTKILVNQTGDKLDTFTDLEYGEYSSMKKALTGKTDIMTYQSLMRGIQSGQVNPANYDLLILDEAHRALGQKTRVAIDTFDAVKVGFTATPDFNKQSVTEMLPAKFHEMGLLEAAETGLVSRFKCVVAKTSVNLDEVPVVNGDYDKKLIERAVNVSVRNKAAAKLYKTTFSDASAVVYCSGLDHARDVLKEFIAQGIRAEVISGNVTTEQRERMLRDFKSGATKVLINARVLVEGFDEPKSSVCINLHPTLSRVDAEQRAGRVLRLDSADPEKWAYIVDFVDVNSTKPGITFSEIAGQAEAENLQPDTTLEPKAGNGGGGERTKLPVVDIEGLDIVYDTEEVLSIAKRHEKEREESEITRAPEGWETANFLSKHRALGSKTQSIQKYAESFREHVPVWIKLYMSGSQRVEHYHPELVQKIIEHFSNKNVQAPDGWETERRLRARLLCGRKTVLKIADAYREKHPEWYGDFKSGPNDAEFYHPDLVKIIEQEVSRLQVKAPAGWLTPSALKDTFGGGKGTYEQAAEQYREDHPEWFKEFKAGPQFTEHYHPELIRKLIAERLAGGESAPEGWLSNARLHDDFRVGEEVVRKIAESYRADHPEWFHSITRGSKTATYYAPPLVEEIRQKLLERK